MQPGLATVPPHLAAVSDRRGVPSSASTDFPEEDQMNHTFGAAALLTLALAVQEAAAQDALGGALFGGAAGAILGGAIGGGRGAAIGAILGAGTGAVIAAEGQRRANGYYYYDNGCYIQRQDGAWMQVHPNYCSGGAPAPAAVAAPGGDAVAYCMQKYRSYDPASGTFLSRDGIRKPCP
jgi:hypothetical protein